MVFNSMVDGKDCFFSVLIYVIFFIDVFMFGGFLL